MEKPKPLRMCCVCRNRFTKEELLRFVSFEGQVTYDNTKKAKGRGAYICKNPDCLLKAKNKGILRGVLKCEINEELWTSIQS